MQFLGQVFEYVLEARGERLNILGATSGDTGSAAEYAMLGKARVNVVMLSPHGRMSAFQQAQMFSLHEPNIFNLAVEGVFDDCQDLVKAVNADADFKARYDIGAVNSINWARVLAQAVYYFRAYLALNLPAGAEADFSVPSGNFGNVFAGYLARSMGLPVGQLIVASNENDVLHDFFSGGTYHVRPADRVAVTSSPSMDIGKASNFERYLYLIAGADAAQTRGWWDEVGQSRPVALSGTAHWDAVQASGFRSGRSTHADRLRTIRAVFDTHGRLIDPHTADGVLVGQAYRRPGVPMICLETALPPSSGRPCRRPWGRPRGAPPALTASNRRPDASRSFPTTCRPSRTSSRRTSPPESPPDGNPTHRTAYPEACRDFCCVT